jgi:hypothetical protein
VDKHQIHQIIRDNSQEMSPNGDSKQMALESSLQEQTQVIQLPPPRQE